MALKVGVIGGGSWGTTVAHLTAHNTPTTLWCRDGSVAREINDADRNPRYLDGFALHPELSASTDLEAVVADAEVIVIGVPSSGFREVMGRVAPMLGPRSVVISLTKGLEQGTKARMTEVAHQEAPGHNLGVLTGPNLAKEILAGGAAASVLAMDDHSDAERLQYIFSTEVFRVYTNSDVTGCELAGALKNVIALASGMADGLGIGDNTKSAVITRGLAELTRLGVAMGGKRETFMGLAGLGDLLATCISRQSRNRYVGEQLGMGRRLEDVIGEMEQVAEGVQCAPAVVELAAEHGVEMPIAEQVAAVLEGRATAKEAYAGLMSRQQGRETDPTV